MDLLHAMIDAFGASAEWKFGMLRTLRSGPRKGNKKVSVTLSELGDQELQLVG